MKTARIVLAGILAVLPAQAVRAAPYAWIGANNEIVAIDVAQQSVVARIPRASQILDVAALPDVRHVYVISADRISKIDSTALASVAELPEEPGQPTGSFRIDLKPGREEAYVRLSRNAATHVEVLRTDVLGFIGDPGLAVDADAGPAVFDTTSRRAYFPGANGGVAEVDFDSNAIVRVLPYGVRSVEVHPSLRRLYLVEPATIRLLDLDSGAIVSSGGVPTAFFQEARVNPSGTRLLVTDLFGHAVHVFDANTLQLIATLPAGEEPRGIDVTPSGERFVVVNRGGVAFIDPAVPAVVGTLALGAATFAQGRFIGGAAQGSSMFPGPGTGLWWNPAEPGWGLHVTQRRSTFFAALFHYDANGAPRWLVVPNCAMNSPCPDCIDNVTCNGAIFETNGPAFFQVPFNPASVQTREVGLMELRFTDRDRAHLTYIVSGQHRGLPIERQRFAARPVLSTDYTDLWWNPLESGWGLGITQQDGVMFLTWFVYDEGGRPAWYVASNCGVIAAGNGCRGVLYRTSGPLGPVPGSAGFDRSALRVAEVGTIDVSFEGADNGVITYTVDGRTGTKAITRQLF